MDDTPLGVESLNHKNIQLSHKPQDILLEADKGKIIQVISNLLGNAIKFTEEGTITVRSEIKDSKASPYQLFHQAIIITPIQC
jgi:signal transduction histidine kinase